MGPRAELEHWKKRLAKFDCLTKSMKSQECRTVVAILVAAKSKVLKVKECTRFLFTMKYCLLPCSCVHGDHILYHFCASDMERIR